jgi:hypothetical protein
MAGNDRSTGNLRAAAEESSGTIGLCQEREICRVKQLCVGPIGITDQAIVRETRLEGKSDAIHGETHGHASRVARTVGRISYGDTTLSVGGNA